jgi:hypothetical protein
MTQNLFDPISVWQTLSSDVRDLIGRAAIAHVFGVMGATAKLEPLEAFEAADREGFYLLDELCRQYLPAAFGDDGTPLLPDLKKLGISTSGL